MFLRSSQWTQIIVPVLAKVQDESDRKVNELQCHGFRLWSSKNTWITENCPYNYPRNFYHHILYNAIREIV